MNRALRKCAMALCLAVPVFGVTAVVAPVLPVSAQEFPDPDDFTDPDTGEFDTDAYLAALAAMNAADGEDLPATGTDTDSTVAAGLGLLAVGGAAVLVGRRRQALKGPKHLV